MGQWISNRFELINGASLTRREIALTAIPVQSRRKSKYLATLSCDAYIVQYADVHGTEAVNWMRELEGEREWEEVRVGGKRVGGVVEGGDKMVGSKGVDLTVAGQSPTYATLMEFASDVARAVYRKWIPDIEFITE